MGPSMTPTTADVPSWGRRRLLVVLLVAATAAIALLAGLGVAGWCTLAGPCWAAPSSPGASHATAASAPAVTGGPGPVVAVVRDDIAGRPMTALDPMAAHPAPLSTRDPGTLKMPVATAAGPVGVPTGFPQTPSGALAQLAAIDETALDGADVARARDVITAWAAPGGPTRESWSTVAALVGFRSAAQNAATGVAPRLDATAVMGLIKGTDGPDWTVVCVLFEIDAGAATTARVGVGDCQRMAWDGRRWLIGAGAEPATAPSAWPGTDAAIDAGYQDLTRG